MNPKKIMNQSEHIPTSEELNDLEADTVWSLLDEASNQEASPMFVDNIMNEIRSEALDNVVSSPSFWKRYSLPISAAAVAGIAACVILTLNMNDQPANSGQTVQSEVQFTDEDIAFFEEQMPFDDYITATSEIEGLAEQMIEIENQDPFIMTADDINELVSM